MSEWVNIILWKLLDWGIPFTIGILFRKKVGRAIIKAQKWLLNDTVTINIISVRTYLPVEVHDFNLEVYENIKTKILNPKLLDIFVDVMRITIPIFGNLSLRLSRETNQEDIDSQVETAERIKVAVKPESPVRLGIRDVHLLNEFAQDAEILFGAVENLFVATSKITQNYTILEISRIGRLVEEKTFEISDDDLGARIHATQNKLTIIVSPSSQIAKAAKKYVLI